LLTPPVQNSTFTQHHKEVGLISSRLAERGQTLASAIRQRHLYFRVSVLGSCNLSCTFCHNEGGPRKGKLDLAFAFRAIRVANELGFERVQFTGGEPLLHPLIPEFIAGAREILADVGVTTNGTFLPKKLDSIVDAGLHRIHISLQAEALRDRPNANYWTIPRWLDPVLDLGRRGVLNVRLNLPVPVADLSIARAFLADLSPFQCDVNMFSILPDKDDRLAEPNPIIALEGLAAEENARRHSNLIAGKILVRGYRTPAGIRCTTCNERNACREQSHSLRLGVDKILRPCLATRRWDIRLTDDNFRTGIEAASLLALDYE
jgi:hypothetical protein